MKCENLPSVLQQPNGNSISMERALKQIKSLLEDACGRDTLLVDRHEASISDVEVMLASIDRTGD